MVQIRENLTQLEGTILRRSPHPGLPDYDVVSLRVEDANPVPGVANLLESVTPGTELPVVVRRELLGSAPAGSRVRSRVARTSAGEVMAEPHPSPDAFSVEA